MARRIRVPAVYEDGVLKPLRPLDLAEHEQVELEIEVILREGERRVATFGGLLANDWEGDGPTVEELNALLAEDKRRWQERLLRQVEGDFSEDEQSDDD